MYYLIEKTVTTNGTAKAITDKASKDEALMVLHQTIASAMANATVSSCLCLIIDEIGSTIRHEYWERGVDDVK